MFLDIPSTDLRQGDICEVASFPRWTLSSDPIQILGKNLIAVDNYSKVASLAGSDNRLVCVCSYDCDLENPRDRVGVLLAPVFALSEHPRDQERSQLILKSDVADEDGAFSFMHLFPLRDIPGVTTSHVIDFSAATSLSPAPRAVGKLLETKQFEMTEKTRADMQIKLAIFLARPPAPELDP